MVTRYRTIKSDYNVVVILEDGGIADIHDAAPYKDEPHRASTTEYYQQRFTEAGLVDYDSVWDEVGEGKMYYNDWDTAYNDNAHVLDALEWLAPGCKHTLDESIWPNFRTKDQNETTSCRKPV